MDSGHSGRSLRAIVVIGLLGAYVNIAGFGFEYGTYNHEFELPWVNWLINPSLYPHDPITEAFARFPTIFWPIVAHLSRWMPIKTVLLLFFFLTKILFFLALARILTARVRNRALSACIVLAVALSPFLNDLTPFGASNILDSVQTHTSLAMALALWVACFLLEERWILAAVLCALTIYWDALFFVFMLFAFAAFAVFDWRRRRTAILISALLGAVISLPWLRLYEGVTFRSFPPGYVESLLAFYPFHLRISSPNPYELISGAGILVAAGIFVWIARKLGCAPEHRFELLVGSFFFAVLFGAILGEFHLTPTFARLQLLRADSFLLLYAILLIQIYGANLFRVSAEYPAAHFFLCTSAIFLPLTDSLGLLWMLFAAMILWFSRVEFFENWWRAMAQRGRLRFTALSVLLAAIIFFLCIGRYVAKGANEDWTPAVTIQLLIFVGFCVIYAGPCATSVSPNRLGKIAVAVFAAGFIMAAHGVIPNLSRLWNPIVPPTPLMSDWLAVQRWAKLNTPVNAQFLVPTYPCGFREFSERSSWGEWKDGQAMYLYPAFAAEYHRRMLAIGYPWGQWFGTKILIDNYKSKSWDSLTAIARHNRLSYIIQFREVKYSETPVFSNERYAVYMVTPDAQRQ